MLRNIDVGGGQSMKTIQKSKQSWMMPPLHATDAFGACIDQNRKRIKRSGSDSRTLVGEN
jgi:hypothetical protein